jgi:hypothetical protein
VLLVASGYRLQANLVRARALYPVQVHSRFGRVDVQRREEVQLVERLTELMQHVPARALFCYPFISHLYLLADADNPTRYQFFQPGYNSPDQIQELLRSLERASPVYLAVIPLAALPGDPIMSYIDARYAPLPETQAWETKIYRRGDGA